MRGVLVFLILATGALLAIFAGPRIWFWVSTRSEPVPEGIPANSGPFEFSPDLAGDVRVLRWGDHAELRHGPFFAERGGRTITGAYDRGSMAGRWQVRQGDEVLFEGLGVPWARESTDGVRGTLFGVEVEVQQNEDWQWRVPPLDILLPGEDDLLGAMRGEDGGFVIAPAGIVDVDELWCLTDERLEFDASGTLVRQVAGRRRTAFDATGAIARQERVDRDRNVIETRTAPPWWDPVTGEETGEGETP